MKENTPTPLASSSQDNEIILYQPDSTVKLEVRLENDTVWLNRQQIATLFDRDVKTIGKHISNALKEELDGVPTIANFATVQMDLFVRTSLPPKEAIIYDGQIFDVYSLM